MFKTIIIFTFRQKYKKKLIESVKSIDIIIIASLWLEILNDVIEWVISFITSGLFPTSTHHLNILPKFSNAQKIVNFQNQSILTIPCSLCQEDLFMPGSMISSYIDDKIKTVA